MYFLGNDHLFPSDILLCVALFIVNFFYESPGILESILKGPSPLKFLQGQRGEVLVKKEK